MRLRISIAILLLIMCAQMGSWSLGTFSPQAKITFYNIGQGDAIHIGLPENFDVLIDGGPDASLTQALGKNLSPFNKSIECIVMTHMDADHIAGFLPLLDRYQIHQVVWNGEAAPTSFSETLLKKIADAHIPLQVVHQGDRIQLPHGIHADVLNAGGTNGDGARNDGSIVLRMVVGPSSFLFTGDLEKTREKILIENDIFLKSDVLKVGHHGSRSSTSLEFTQSVDPRDAIISAAKKNRYGHPHTETLQTLQANHVRIRTTFEEGDIVYVMKPL